MWVVLEHLSIGMLSSLIFLQYVLSDGIVTWRTWILFPGNHIVKLLLILSMVGSGGN